MSARATFLRWLASFLGFPLGSLLAVTLAGSITDPLRGALAGLLAGSVIGLAQWLALRPAGLSILWVGATASAVALGSAIAAAITGAGTSGGALVLSGLITGALVGAAQALVVGGGVRVVAVWTALVAAAWGLGWFVTANVIVDADRGYVTFGASGAVLATVLTGLFVRRLVVRAASGDGRRSAVAPAPAPAATEDGVV